jgi:hypothetical protein
LRSIGTDLPEEFNFPISLEDSEVLLDFSKLPKMFSGREVSVEFQSSANYGRTTPEACNALGLEIGATIQCYTKILSGDSFFIFAERDTAYQLLKIKPFCVIQARAVTAFGVYQRVEWTEEEGPISIPDTETGLIITKILNISEPTQ